MATRRFRLRGFKRLSEAVMDSLGELEQRSMRAIWRTGETSVGELCSEFGEVYAYTTVMTTLDRLYKKGLLERRKRGRAFVYSSIYSLEEMERGVAQDVIAKLLDGGVGRAEPVLACIVDSVSERDHQLLDELERLLIEKRRQLSEEEA
ncbi:MAG: BlaI/MecI/CopY family transcriptional regulator [Pyrinomonadaceae bacterium]